MAAPKADFIQRQKQLNDDLEAGRFRTVYLIFGDQSYLRLQNKERLRKALLGDGDEMNLSRCSGQDVQAADVLEQAQTLPFFADRRVIFVENCGWFDKKASAESDAMAEMISGIPDTAAVVFVEEAADRRKKLFKAISKYGTVLECDTPDETTLRTWAGSLFSREGIRIEGAALALFLDRTGEDMQNIASEAEKLVCYSMQGGHAAKGTVIRREDVKKVVAPRVKDRIVEMVEAVALRDRQRALTIYADLLALQTPPQIILTLMMRQFSQLIQVQEMLGTHSDKEIASAMRLPYFVIGRRYKPALKGYTREELVDALEDCVKADRSSKSGRIDAGAAVELLLVRLAERPGGSENKGAAGRERPR